MALVLRTTAAAALWLCSCLCPPAGPIARSARWGFDIGRLLAEGPSHWLVALDWGTTAHLIDDAPSQHQRHRNDCGPASLRRIRAAGLCRGPLPFIDTIGRGCTLADLARAATACGACGRIVRFTALQQLSLPAILHLRRRHFVVLETLQPDVARLFDPGHGLLLMRPRDVVPHLSGAALEFITPTVAARQGGS